MKKFLLWTLLVTMVISANTTINARPIDFKLPAVKDVVMYQVNPRVFAPSNSLKAVASRVAAISDLGANVMWEAMLELNELTLKQ